MGGTRQEIRGVFFAGARDYIRGRHGAEVLERVAEAAGPEAGAILRAPDAEGWYPEDAFREMLRAFCEVVAGNDARRFEEIIRGGALMGIRQFVQIITRQTSPRDLLERTPGLWSLLRRGPARLRIEAEPHRVVSHYEGYPFHAHPVYVPFFRGLLASMLEASSGYVPPIRVLDEVEDHLAIEVRVAEG